MISKIMKRILVFVLLPCLVLALIFYKTIIGFLAVWPLQVYAVKAWGNPFEYQDIRFDGRHLVIHKPHVENGSFSAEEVTLTCTFNWLKRRLDIDVAIDQPCFHFRSPYSSHWGNLERLMKNEDKWVKTHPSFHIRKGLLTWSLPDNSRHQLTFDLQVNSQDGGNLKLYFDPEDITNNCLTCQTSSQLGQMEITCDCQNAGCAPFAAFVQLLDKDCPPWMVTSGSLQGNLKAVFPHDRRPYVEGEMIVDQLVFTLKGSELQGRIEKALLKLSKNQAAYLSAEKIPTIVGQLEILKPSSLVYTSQNLPWKLDNMIGRVDLNEVATAIIALKAQGYDGNHSSQWSLQGTANLNAQRSLNLDLNLFCSSLGQPDGNIHLYLHQPKEGYKRAEIQLTKLSHAECDFFQTLLATHWPVFKEVKFEQGTLDALLEASVTSKGIQELEVKQFQASQVRCLLNPWNARCHFSQTSGKGKVHLGKKNNWSSMEAELHLEDGEILLEEFAPFLPLKAIEAHLSIQQGQIRDSLVTLQLAGLKGIMDIEWGTIKKILTFKLEGTVQDLADLIPNSLQEGLRKNFYNNQLMVLADLTRQNQQFKLAGAMHIQRAHTDQMDLINFGCDLKKTDTGGDSKLVPSGWFYAHQLPLEKFVSPFIFRNGVLQMQGEGEVRGAFDDRYLTLNYNAENLKIENEDLCIEVKHLRSPNPGQLLGFHQIDLQTHSHYGILPIKQASYLARNKELAFHDIQGIVAFRDKTIHLSSLEGYCEGVYFAGALDMDYSDPAPGVFNLVIDCPTFSGKISQIQHLLAHLDHQSPLHKIPLEGEVSSKGKGLKLDFAFIPHDYILQGELQGSVIEGSLSFEEADMALKGIYMDIDYRHQQEKLEFSDIQGTLLVGKPRKVEEYLFTGHHLSFHQLANPDIHLDLSVWDHEEELLRFVGNTSDEGKGVKKVHLEPSLSHLSCLHPRMWQCRLKEWTTIQQFEMQTQVDWGDLLKDLQKFRQTGLWFCSPYVIDKLSSFSPIEGKGSFNLSYHPLEQLFAFQIEGKHIKQSSSKEHYGLIKGRKQDKKWILDHLQWDDWNLYAELLQTGDKWKIPFLGLSAGQSLLLGLEGDCMPDENLLQAKINLCEINLGKIDRWETFQNFEALWKPRGYLKATGSMEWNFAFSDPLEGLKIFLQAEAEELTFRGYPLKVMQPFQIDCQTYRNLCLRNVKIGLPPQESQAFLEVQRLDYQIDQDHLRGSQFSFQIPRMQLEAVGQTLHCHFPDFLDAFLKDLIVSSKPQGDLCGIFSFEKNLSQNFLKLQLADGIYRFKKRDFDLKNFELQIAGNEMSFSGITKQENYPFQIKGKTDWPACQQGNCLLIDLGTPSQPLVQQPLSVKWENHPQWGFSLDSLQGEFAGCLFHLMEDKDAVRTYDWSALKGQLAIDFNRLSPLLPSEMANTIQKCKVGSTFSLAGQFRMNPGLGQTLLETVFFQGSLCSQNVILKGYECDHIQAQIDYEPGRMDMHNLSLEDFSGNVHVPALTAFKDQKTDLWSLYIPQLIVKNLRPSLLRAIEVEQEASSSSKFRSLLVKRAEIREIFGELGDMQTWKGQGNMHFLNPTRKNLYHPLLAIPAEIILRLGLDPQVLNPVTGIIYFDLQGDRFYLTRFKDVYSEGRGSKFYLAESPTPSWMDFDGNLLVRIRMKQYNLIFKIAELFTVSIQGR